MHLDDLPLDVLLALQDAMTDPSEAGAERARLRAAGAGFHVALGNAIGDDGAVVLRPPPGPAAAPPALPQPEAEPGVQAVELPLGDPEP